MDSKVLFSWSWSIILLPHRLCRPGYFYSCWGCLICAWPTAWVKYPILSVIYNLVRQQKFLRFWLPSVPMKPCPYNFYWLDDSMPWRRRRSQRMMNFCAANVHLLLSRASLFTSISESPISEQSSWMLSIHFFLCLPFGLVPPIHTCSSMFRYLSSLIHTMWPK